MKLSRFLALAVLTLPLLAHAHPGHEGHELSWDFTTGATHPLSGWDHLVAMIAVGMWAAMLGGRSRWLVPGTFVGVMIVGAALGQAGLVFPGVEQGIAVSILILGLLISFFTKLPLPAGMAIVGGFALFHGVAHGLEMPVTSGGLGYGFGFVACTMFLHTVGLGLGSALKDREAIIRFAGAAVALAGAFAFAL